MTSIRHGYLIPHTHAVLPFPSEDRHLINSLETKMLHIIFFLFAILLTTAPQSHGAVQEFCVADLKAPPTPAGYPCKNSSTVTVDDFVFSNFKPGSTANRNNISVVAAFVNQFPGVNGLGISAVRLDMAPGGVVPLHSHSGATEMIMVVRGLITAGFITTTQVFYKTLTEGDVIVFPQGLLHFQVNAGKGDATATAFVAFSSDNPGLDIVANELFGNSLPTELVAKTTSIDPDQVKKLKAVFGGSG